MALLPIRAVFVTPTILATGETITASTLAQSLFDAGGKVWFLASPMAAGILATKFPGRVREMTQHRSLNRVLWREVIREARPNLIVFSDLYSTLGFWPSPPLADFQWLSELQELDASLAWIDLLGFNGALRRNILPLCRAYPHLHGIAVHLTAILSRMLILLPCPLHEPGPVRGRRGIPYRSMALPIALDAQTRSRARARFLGPGRDRSEVFVFHTVGTWLWKLAQSWNAPLYDYFSDLLEVYLSNLPRPVTVVSVNSGSLLRASSRLRLRLFNLQSMSPPEYDRLVISSDLVITDNVASYTLAKTLGRVPGMVLINSYGLEDLLKHETEGSPVWRLAMDMERNRPGSFYPHLTYPFPNWANPPVRGPYPLGPVNTFISSFFLPDDSIRIGKLPSSPFIRAELYGGQQTRDLFHRVLLDDTTRRCLSEKDEAYIERQSILDDGPTIVQRMLTARPRESTVLDSQ